MKRTISFLFVLGVFLTVGCSSPGPKWKYDFSNVYETEADAWAEISREFAGDRVGVADPLRWMNKPFFRFNDFMYFYVVKGVSKAWWVITWPGNDVVRIGIRNFIRNLGFPGRFFNSFFTLKFNGCLTELTRFIVNTCTTLGFYDTSQHLGLVRQNGVFDRNLQKWMRSGPYIHLPLWGPTTARGLLGALFDNVFDPVTTYWAVQVITAINNQAMGIDPYAALDVMAVNNYSAVRDAFMQDRKKIEPKDPFGY